METVIYRFPHFLPPFIIGLYATKLMASILKNLPDLGQAVTGLADDVQKIMVSLYELQKSLNGNNTPPFASVRKELKDQWEMLRAYLQRCHGFGADVLTLKDALGEETKEDLKEFLEEMKASASELREISGKLKSSDMSAVFSKGNKSGGSVNDSSPSSTKGIHNENLRAFIVAFVAPMKPQSLLETDKALLRIKTNVDIVFQFWDDTYKGCSSLLEEFGVKGVSMTTADAERITSKWMGYQEAIEKAIVSITKTNDAILVEGTPTPGLLVSAPVAGVEMRGGGNDTVSRRFGLGSLVTDWFKRFLG